MSVLIKDMKMPKEGCHHMICIYADGTVSTGGRVYTAIPVSPHGRLVDIDEVYRVLTEYYHHTTDLQHKALREALSRVPIIAKGEDE